MKIAIVHDYLMDLGGAERVLLALHEIYPTAPIYVSIYRKNKLGKFADNFKNAKIIQSWFGNLPFADKLISPLRFMLPVIWKDFDLEKYDLIIDSSAWAITRGFKTKKSQIEICYCHTPPRYLYGFDTSRKWNKKWFGSLVKFYSYFVNIFLRWFDRRSSKKVDYFIANSKNVADRIQNFYHRESTVIYPPVEILVSNAIYNIQNTKYFLAGGRLVAAKNFDLIIKACIKAKVNLKIFGAGILENDLMKLAKENVEFLGKVPDENLFELYKNAEGFIVAQKDEDFGITTIEAQSAGCPVIAYRGGGYLESVIENNLPAQAGTGIFFDELNKESIVSAINKLQKTKWNKKVIMENARKFSKERFKKEMLEFVRKVTNARTSRS